MKANGNSGRMSFLLRVLLWINILNSLLLLGAYLGTHISPNSVSYLAFLGLAYPIWLVIAVLFIVFWFLKRRKLIWISIFALLIGYNHFRHFFAMTLFNPDVENPVKVMSFNVKIFNFFDLENRVKNRNEIFSFIKKENPAIICFQEFFHQEGSKDFVTRDSLIELMEFEHKHEHYTHDLAQSRYFGLVTFSKYPIIHKGEIPFDNDNNNFCIFSDVLINHDTLRVFNGHIGSIRFQDGDYNFFGEQGPGRYMDKEGGQRILSRLHSAFKKRAVQVEKVVREIDKSPHPVLLCMDMNDTPVSFAYRQFITRLYDAFVESGNGIGTTYIGKMPSNRIDYIFHSESIVSTNFTTHQVNFSDHKPISCEIGIEKED